MIFRVPAVDGNVLRVYARIMEDDSDILKQSVKTKVEKEFLKVMPGSRSGTFNQALMELGAMICVPNGAPKCGVCPVGRIRQARVHGTILDLPVKKKDRNGEKKKKLFWYYETVNGWRFESAGEGVAGRNV